MLAERTENFTGADLAGLVRQAAMNALRDLVTVVDSEGNSKMIAEPINTEGAQIYEKHFLKALQLCKPSVSEKVSHFC